MIKCVVFDFDGTLVNSNKIKRDVFYRVTKDIIGAKLILDKIFSTPDSGDRYSIFSSLAKELSASQKKINPEFLSNLYTEVCEKEISNAPEIQGALDALEKLNQKKVKIFLSSATPVHTLHKIISMRGWSALFDGVMGYPDSKEEHLRSILLANKYSLKEVVYVGDSEIDRNTALSIGCGFIGIGNDSKRFRIKPNILLKTLENFITELEL